MRINEFVIGQEGQTGEKRYAYRSVSSDKMREQRGGGVEDRRLQLGRA